mgnify:CR=1 FL=1|jgi:hypothetical protein|tara:strand:+ start:329 stop:529 length:201 start_codon:yes stop_codon:yes gene_type:complete
MKPGDLVKLRHNYSVSTARAEEKLVGLVVQHYKAEGYLEECLLVLWNNGNKEIEFMHWLELINEVR